MPRKDHETRTRSQVPGLRQHLRKILGELSEVAERKAQETSAELVESVYQDREENCSRLVSDL